jgi:hypothetical protein
MKTYGQIKDNRGNTIAASRDMRMLYDAGWCIVDIKHRGMFKQIWWYRLNDPNRDVMPQGQAVIVQKSIAAQEKSK